jgi:hypothetical protein
LRGTTGLVSSLNAVLSTVIGVHYGHVFALVADPASRLAHMVLFSLVQLLIGIPLHLSGAVLLNTDLYSIS